MLSGAGVFLVGRGGTRLLGRTDQSGTLSVKRSELESADALALLVCAEFFFCGGFRLDDGAMPDQSHFYLTLAPFAID